MGDSKVLQWISALDQIGERNGWRIRTYAKSACPFTAASVLDQDGRRFDSCTKWNQAVVERLLADPPDAVITSHHLRDAPGGRNAMTQCLRALDRASQAGITIAVLRENAHHW